MDSTVCLELPALPTMTSAEVGAREAAPRDGDAPFRAFLEWADEQRPPRLGAALARVIVQADDREAVLERLIERIEWEPTLAITWAHKLAECGQPQAVHAALLVLLDQYRRRDRAMARKLPGPLPLNVRVSPWTSRFDKPE